MKEIIEYLEKYNQPFAAIEDTQESRTVIKEVLKLLEEYPDVYCRIKGTYYFRRCEEEEYELFYIRDMVLFKRLLNQKRYYSFIHELYDFLYFKLCKENPCDETVVLPKNIKTAIITTIKENFPIV